MRLFRGLLLRSVFENQLATELVRAYTSRSIVTADVDKMNECWDRNQMFRSESFWTRDENWKLKVLAEHDPYR